VRAWFKAYFLALVIRHGIVNSYFSIQMILAFNGYLCLFGLLGNGDLMIFSTVPGRMALGFALISSHERGLPLY